ncbi:hypothetical protein FPZ42_17535 [Mucilaginibacter achroorhodeus]|uniref:Uncharacterized protein n=2 Tax=Mucilaginibacter achroorhodeus TaxID=2599294 RepID=A0A563TYC0_9SPHI|nr:hypothetical protein FPZ42_17535 [Mucilaginibacter achroorhodeus]
MSRPQGSFSRPSMGAAPNRGSFGGTRPQMGGAVQGRSSYGFSNRGNYAGRPSMGVNSRGSYSRGYYGGRYGYGYGRPYGYGYRSNYYGPRYFGYGFYNYRGYYNSYYLPRIGFSIGVLPFGYYPFWWNNYQYYYADGLYYQYNDNQYTVVEPPVGAEVKSLPSKAEPITINGEQFYESNGVYYRAVTKDDGTVTYEVAGKDGQLETSNGGGDQGDYQAYQVGDIITSLPEDSRKIKVNGEKLWVSPDGTYFQEQRDENNKKVYKVVGLSTEEDQGDDNQQ